jgi:hypothetical protein
LHPEIHRAKLRQHVAPFGAISVQILHAAILNTVFYRNYNKLLTPLKNIRGKEWAKGLFHLSPRGLLRVRGSSINGIAEQKQRLLFALFTKPG